MAYFNLPFSVRISNADPIDGDRYLADDIASRDQIVSDGRAHEGLQVYVIAPIKQLYILEQVDPPIWKEGSGKALIAGNGIIFNETTSSIEISSEVGNSVNDKLIAAGGETTMSLSQEIDVAYKYQIFTNGVLQREGAGTDYTLIHTSGSHSTVYFVDSLIITDFVDVYYNDSDVAGAGDGSGLQNIVEDLTPELGGQLDALFNNIVNVSNLYATVLHGNGANITGLSYYTDSDNLSYLNTLGVISGSSQISITESQISDLTHYTNTDNKNYLDSINVLSGSLNFDGLVSSSAQIDHDQTTNYDVAEHFTQGSISITESQISDLTHYTDSDTLAYINSQNVLSGSLNFDGLVSSSAQIDHDQTTNFTQDEHFLQSEIQITEDQITDFTSSLYLPLTGGTLTGTLTSNSQINTSNSVKANYGFIVTYDNYSSSWGAKFRIKSNSADGTFQTEGYNSLGGTPKLKLGLTGYSIGTDLPATQMLDVGGSGVFLNSVTASNFVKDGGISTEFLKADGTVDTTIYLSSLPSGVISGSSQLDGTTINSLSGSFSGSFIGDGSQLSGVTSYTDADTRIVLATDNVFSSSVQIDHDQTTNYDVAEHFTQGSISITESQISDLVHTTIPAGTISGSSQLDNSTIDNLTITTALNFGSASIQYQENVDVDSVITRIVASIPTGSADAVFFDYLVNGGTNYRAGTVMAVHDGLFATYTDNSTSDIGDTSDVTLSVDIENGNIRLMAFVLSDNWIIKTLIRTI